MDLILTRIGAVGCALCVVRCALWVGRPLFVRCRTVSRIAIGVLALDSLGSLTISTQQNITIRRVEGIAGGRADLTITASGTAITHIGDINGGVKLLTVTGPAGWYVLGSITASRIVATTTNSVIYIPQSCSITADTLNFEFNRIQVIGNDLSVNLTGYSGITVTQGIMIGSNSVSVNAFNTMSLGLIVGSGSGSGGRFTLSSPGWQANCQAMVGLYDLWMLGSGIMIMTGGLTLGGSLIMAQADIQFGTIGNSLYAARECKVLKLMYTPTATIFVTEYVRVVTPSPSPRHQLSIRASFLCVCCSAATIRCGRLVVEAGSTAQLYSDSGQIIIGSPLQNGEITGGGSVYVQTNGASMIAASVSGVTSLVLYSVYPDAPLVFSTTTSNGFNAGTILMRAARLNIYPNQNAFAKSISTMPDSGVSIFNFTG